VRSAVRVCPGLPTLGQRQESGRTLGAIAQLVERVLCKHEVVGSIPSGSTSLRPQGARGLGKPTAASDQENKFPARRKPGGFDIVNEGSVRTLDKSVGQDGPDRRHHCLAKYTKRMRDFGHA
jgi:hypothetical protein